MSDAAGVGQMSDAAGVAPVGAGGTREKIQSVALRLFAEQGYESTSMRQISEQLGITKAALYYHFTSKESIVGALIETMLAQVTTLVEWARAQETGPDLRREVLARWTAIMHNQGLAMFRFLGANYRLVRDIRGEPGQPGCMAAAVSELFTILTPPDASVEDQLRVRFSLLIINMTGIASRDLDAGEEDILDAAARISNELLPPGFRA
jgi:AcrR family transcriptional regulator